ncbi:MAG: lysophospholipid acyltransferase family protein [Corticimicrobacter sp.]|uniref:lysophospholipid acyltransferase family protein n=1 Tax=Corticimicrobacter sp. TaxID=2678536 RepID=UPI0032DA604F
MIWLRSTLYALFLAVTVVPFALLSIVALAFPLKWRYRITLGWPRLGIWGARVIAGIRWQVKGWENLPDGPAILLSKHQSAWETMYLIGHMPRNMCFVYKRELHKVPFFGWGLAGLRMIAIDRAKGSEAFEQVVRQSQRCLDEGRWPILFPEGTRTRPGQETRYKSGGARLACRTGVPVIPIAVNSGVCWPRNSFLKHPGLITVSIGPAIPPDGLSAEELNEKVQDWIETEVRAMNPELYAR